MIVVASARSARSTAARSDRRRSDARGGSRTAPPRREVEPVRGRDVLLERVLSPATGRKWKIPPPSLLSSTIVSGRPRRRAASRPPMSWASATSPISSTTGPSPGGRDAEGGRDGPVDPVGAAVGEHARAVVAHGDELLDVADRHRRGDEQGRIRAAAIPSAGLPPTARTAPSPSASAIAAAARASAARHDASHAVARPLERARCEQRPVGSTRFAGRRPRPGPARLPSGSNAIWAASQAGQPGAQRL